MTQQQRCFSAGVRSVWEIIEREGDNEQGCECVGRMVRPGRKGRGTAYGKDTYIINDNNCKREGYQPIFVGSWREYFSTRNCEPSLRRDER